MAGTSALYRHPDLPRNRVRAPHDAWRLLPIYPSFELAITTKSPAGEIEAVAWNMRNPVCYHAGHRRPFRLPSVQNSVMNAISLLSVKEQYRTRA